MAFRWIVLPEHGPDQAVAAWTGPLRQPHDFLLPSGSRLEVKAIGPTADSARINGLGQLESGCDPLTLIAVRLERTAADANGALTIGGLSCLLRIELAASPSAQDRFDRLLRLTGWKPDKDVPPFAARIVAVEGHSIDADFPRLTKSTVPDGIVDATYTVRLPAPDLYWNTETWTSPNSMET